MSEDSEYEPEDINDDDDTEEMDDEDEEYDDTDETDENKYSDYEDESKESVLQKSKLILKKTSHHSAKKVFHEKSAYKDLVSFNFFYNTVNVY